MLTWDMLSTHPPVTTLLIVTKDSQFWKRDFLNLKDFFYNIFSQLRILARPSQANCQGSLGLLLGHPVHSTCTSSPEPNWNWNWCWQGLARTSRVRTNNLQQPQIVFAQFFGRQKPKHTNRQTHMLQTHAAIISHIC